MRSIASNIYVNFQRPVMFSAAFVSLLLSEKEMLLQTVSGTCAKSAQLARAGAIRLSILTTSALPEKNGLGEKRPSVVSARGLTKVKVIFSAILCLL